MRATPEALMEIAREGRSKGIPLSMDGDMVRNHIRETIEALSFTQKEYAEMQGISESYLSDILAGRREPGKGLLDCLGMKRVVYYEWKEEP